MEKIHGPYFIAVDTSSRHTPQETIELFSERLDKNNSLIPEKNCQYGYVPLIVISPVLGLKAPNKFLELALHLYHQYRE
jgi:hypothetical protein